MLKGYPVSQKVTPKGPDQVSICDELGVRMCCQNLHSPLLPGLTLDGFHLYACGLVLMIALFFICICLHKRSLVSCCPHMSKIHNNHTGTKEITCVLFK